MALKVLIIDDHVDYRRLLGHHITAEWPNASLRALDPLKESLSDYKEMKSTDVIILGEHSLKHDTFLTVADILRGKHVPPIIYLSESKQRDIDAARAIRLGVSDFIPKASLTNTFIVNAIKQAVRAHRQDQDLFEGFPWHVRRPLGRNIKIPGFVIKQHLNAGAVSDVYLAERLPSCTEVAIKVFRPKHRLHVNDQGLAQQAAEVNTVSRITHPNVIKIFDVGESDAGLYTAMEYLPGGDLKARMRQGLSPASAIDYALQTLRGLQAVHKAGLLHRDIKPANIMFRDPNSLVLVDFGLAATFRAVNRDAHSGSRVLGTPYYMSPEQSQGGVVDVRSDIYSFGVMFYELLTGQKPYTAASPKIVLYKHSYAPVPILPVALSQYQTIIDLTMAKQPINRFESVDLVLDTLKSHA